MSIDLPLKALVPVSRQATQEGIVLLENNNSILPFNQGQKVSLFGRCQIDTYRSGTGSGGAVNVPYAVSALEGLRKNPSIQINEDLASIYETWTHENPFDDGGGGWAAEPWFQTEMQVSDDVASRAASHSEVAIIFIGRTAGEDKDYTDAPGSYRLTDIETQMITTVCKHFDQVVVVLNVTNIMDMSWLNKITGKESIQAVLYSWAAGMEGGDALADILSGDVSPSGRLCDTVAFQIEDYPSHSNFGNKDKNIYEEDIYLGYRYFETFKPQAVQYPFGAGLSYSTFKTDTLELVIKGQGIEQCLEFKVKVKNIGTVSSKEVVQLYCEAPQGKLGKPKRILAGFTKTSSISPGSNEVVSINVPITVLASYDDSGVTGNKSSYVMEAGNYCFYLGGNVREAAKIEPTYTVEQLQITETLTEAVAPVTPFSRMKPGIQKEDGTFEILKEQVPTRSVDLAARIKENLPPSYKQTGDQGIRLSDVKSGKAKMEDFVAQISTEDLCTIVRGEGMCSAKVTPGTAACFGGITDSLFKLGIPTAAAADGPSGIRMDSGHKATQVPIGTLLAATWNEPLNQQLFNLVGQELFAYKIDTLLGPGINIHRHPLNGRNFEYFSEDPLISGIMAAAQTRGLAEAGVSGTIKHFAANDQETARHDVDSVMSERALREIHIKPFEMAVKIGKTTTIMTAYNPVNGHWAASNYDLNTTILRGEWGYTGIVMSDWWAKMNHNVSAGEESLKYTNYMVRSQNDLYMVVENDKAAENPLEDNSSASLETGELTIGELQRSAMNICRFIMAAPVMERPLEAYDPIKYHKPCDSFNESSQNSIDEIILNTSTNKTTVVEVRQAGTYKFMVEATNPRDAAAQSSCSLYLNGNFAFSLALNGTKGKLKTVEGVPVLLNPGYYELTFDFIKPGIELKVAKLKKID